MAMRCLTFLQFSCFKRDITDNEITQYVGIGEYLWLEYAQAHWLEHVQLGSKADHDSLQRLNNALRGFVVRWKKSGASEQPYSKNSNSCAFGFGAFKEISSETYQMLVSGAKYKSQKRFHEDVKGERFNCSWHNTVLTFQLDPFTIEDFAKFILQQLALHASLLSSSENRQSLEDLYLFYGANLFKCQIQYCPFSVKGFRSKAEYDLHSKSHEKKFKCHIKACSYSETGFLTAGELRLHVSCHSTIETTTDQISNLRLSQDPFRAPRQRRPDELFEDAVTSGDMEFVVSAIEADELKINEYRPGEFTLNLAIVNNQVQIVEYLLDNGADINNRAVSSLKLAVSCSSTEIVRAMLLRISVMDKMAQTLCEALCKAVECQDIGKCELILAFGADPCNIRPWNGIERAIQTGDEDIIRLLLDYSTGLDRSSQGVLFHAMGTAESKNPEIFQLVFKACRARPMDWNICLSAAVSRVRLQCAQIAIEQGADVNRIFEDLALNHILQRRPLKAANVMKLLLENGADPSCFPKRGKKLSDYKVVRNIQNHLGVTWDELVRANAHKIIKPSDPQNQDEVLEVLANPHPNLAQRLAYQTPVSNEVPAPTTSNQKGVVRKRKI